jgi:mannose-binding lectin 1
MIIALCLILAPLLVSGDTYQVDERPEIVTHHSLHPPFITDWWQGGLPHWDFGGSAVVTDHYIRLTPDKQSRHGWVWNEEPNDLASWHVSFGFRVHAKASLGADGMAFWYVEQPQRGGGPVFGMPYGFRGLGVVFDTYDNDGQRDNPSVAVLYDDGSHHVRYNAGNDFMSDLKGKCMFDFRNFGTEDIVEARIVYVEKRVEVYLRVGKGQEIQCTTVHDVNLPTGYFFGATAETGHIADNHDVNYIHVIPPPGVTLDHDPYNVPQQQHLPHDTAKDKTERDYWKPKSPEELQREKQAAEEAANAKQKENEEKDKADMTNEDLEKAKQPAAAPNGEELAPEEEAGAEEEAPREPEPTPPPTPAPVPPRRPPPPPVQPKQTPPPPPPVPPRQPPPPPPPPHTQAPVPIPNDPRVKNVHDPRRRRQPQGARPGAQR